MKPESSRAGGDLPSAVEGVPPDPNTMFPKPGAGDIGQKKDESVGVSDPRKEVATPEGISAPFADDESAIPMPPPKERIAGVIVVTGATERWARPSSGICSTESPPD